MGLRILACIIPLHSQEGLKFWRSGWSEPLDPYLRNPRLTDPAFDLADISKGAVQGNILG